MEEILESSAGDRMTHGGVRRGETGCALDALRGVAICLVLSRHAARLSDVNWPWATNGWVGVDLFFVLSGYLVVSSLLTIGDTNYLVARAVRIIPPYLLLFVVLMTQCLPTVGGASMGTSTWVAHALFVTDYLQSPLSPVLWSLSVEVKFYALAPLIAVLLRREHGRAILWYLATWLSVPVLIRLAYVMSNGPPVDYDAFFSLLRSPFPLSIDGFVVGVAIVCINRTDIRFISGRTMLIGASVAVVPLMLVSWDVVVTTAVGAVLFETVLAVVFGVCVWSTVNDKAVSQTLASMTPLCFMGRMAYSLYLFHFSVMLWIRGYLVVDSKIAQFACMIIASIVLSSVVYVSVERPSYLIARRLRRTGAPLQ